MDHSPLLLFHACVFMAYACHEHSDFFKVKGRIPKETSEGLPWFSDGWMPLSRHCQKRFIQKFNYELLTATTLIYAIGAGITAAAGTRLALQLFLDKYFKLFSLQSRKAWAPELLFLVTTSLSQDWVIYAPAAFLRCGSRFSGSLSGIEP